MFVAATAVFKSRVQPHSARLETGPDLPRQRQDRDKTILDQSNSRSPKIKLKNMVNRKMLCPQKASKFRDIMSNKNLKLLLKQRWRRQ